MDDLTLVRGRAQDRPAVDRLLLDTFGVDVAPIAAHRLSDLSYEAFCAIDRHGAVVGCAAVFALTLMVCGRLVDAIGLQSVAVRPAWRGRGVARALLRHVLDWCDGQARPVLLMSDIPAFYAPLGFRVLPQTAFAGPAPAPVAGDDRARRLDMTAAADRVLVAQALRGRAAVSAQFAIVGGAGAALLALIDLPVLQAWWIEDLAAVVVLRDLPGGLELVDVVAPVIPRLDTILAALGRTPSRIVVSFPPDRLGWAGDPVPAADELSLMARAPFAVTGPVVVPQTAWF